MANVQVEGVSGVLSSSGRRLDHVFSWLPSNGHVGRGRGVPGTRPACQSSQSLRYVNISLSLSTRNNEKYAMESTKDAVMRYMRAIGPEDNAFTFTVNNNYPDVVVCSGRRQTESATAVRLDQAILHRIAFTVWHTALHLERERKVTTIWENHNYITLFQRYISITPERLYSSIHYNNNRILSDTLSGLKL